MSVQLPIVEVIPEIKQKLLQHNVVILQAPPGAGKSTILPVHILNEPWLQGKKILLLQPRRLAAINVASRLSALVNESVGGTVGYRIRFENRVSERTKIEVVTEGILTRILQQDNTLENVGLVIFDEFHERSLHADLAFVLCKEVQQILREDLKILIMSATLNADSLTAVLGQVPVITSSGRQYPIKYKYAGYDQSLPLVNQVAKVVRKVIKEEQGDVLVFLPGAGEIQRTKELLEGERVIIKELFGDLPQQKQQEAIMPDSSGNRKVVLATSIAETSITIEGIRVVVDSGFSRVPKFDPKSGLTRLDTVKVTADAADQRAGRSGRLGPGVCYRLWTEGQHLHLLPSRSPEILEADLSPLVLELSLWGTKNITGLSWITAPPASSINQSKELLSQLAAINNNLITAKGREMLKLPTHPRIAHLLLEGKDNGLLPLAIDIAAILEERDPLRKEDGVNLGERVEILRKWRNKEIVNAEISILARIERLAQLWRKIFGPEIDNTMPRYDEVGRLLAAAYPERIAKQLHKKSNRYRLANGRVAQLSEVDPLTSEEWIAIGLMDAGKNEGKIFLAAPLDLKEILASTKEKEVVSWDFQQGVLIARTERKFGEILVDSRPLERVSEAERLKVLTEVIKIEGLSLFNWDERALQLQARVVNLKNWRPDTELPDFSLEGLLNTLESWLSTYIINIKRKEDFKKLDLYSILKNSIPWEVSRTLDILAPEKLDVPSGSSLKLEYFPDGRLPVLSVRLQEVFGLMNTPTINEGRTEVILHLLSPGYKPVQVTQDLKSFWQNTYSSVRKELRMRYPKHSWPEDPWTAEAVRGAIKKRF